MLVVGLFLHPKRSVPFGFFHEISHRDRSGKSCEKMDVVFGSPDTDGEAVEGFRATCEIGVGLAPEFRIAEERKAVFRGIHRVDQDLRQGLRYEIPIRVDASPMRLTPLGRLHKGNPGKESRTGYGI